ncbi:hypothetical protein FACS1894167_05350 [Synergistales bacterium]|nr:hypothetical protein FACS1894167_05350 [Synergistales bacterium]
MKWTNKGHELDELGAKYARVRNLYIWGACDDGKRCFDTLVWLNISSGFNITFVDSSLLKRQDLCCGRAVISPEEMLIALELGEERGNSVVVICSATYRKEMLSAFEYGENQENVFEWTYTSHAQKNNFIAHFLSIFMLYKYGILFWLQMNFISTYKCNLNCRSCLNFCDYIANKEAKDVTFEEFKQHIDDVFSKVDFIYSFHIAGGEPFLNKDLPMYLDYVANHYRSRIRKFFVVTNSTITPPPRLLQALKKADCFVQLDDYSETVPLCAERLPIIKRLLDEHQIGYSVETVPWWYDLQFETTDNYSFDSRQLEEYRDSCNTLMHMYQYGRIYSCCFEIATANARLIEIDEMTDAFIEIAESSKIEFLEYSLGFTNKGYTDFCKRCRGLGANAVKIPVAEQVPKRKLPRR